MNNLNVPRYEIPIVDSKTGAMSRDWYKYLAQLGNSIGSTTYSDDAQILGVADDSATESIALHADRTAKDALALFMYGVDDPVKREDTSLLGWWPQ